MSKPVRYAFLFVVCVVLLLALPGMATAQPTAADYAGPPVGPAFIPGAHAFGDAAVTELGGRLPDVAQAYGVSPAVLTGRFRADKHLGVDRMGRLFFADAELSEFTEPSSEVLPAPAVAAGLVPLADTFMLHSRPGAKRIIYLDFDGHVLSGTAWNDFIPSNGGRDIICPPWDIDAQPSVFGDTERTRIQQVWQRVSEDYAPFDVDVTTDYTGEAAITRSNPADEYYGMRVLISPISSAFGSYGGIAYVGVFDLVDDYYKPALVFPEMLANDEKRIAEAASHENGHALGLYHDGRGTTEDYYAGHGSGETGWAPIMGVGYYRNLTQWSKGEYTGANNTEDDVAVMLTYGLGYRADDHGDTAAAATPLPAGGSPSATGFIGLTDEPDVFSLSAAAGPVTVAATPAALGANLDIRLELRDVVGTLLASNNPVDGLAAGLGATVSAGTYYVTVTGTGKGTPLTGYSNYASLGAYTLSATLTPPAPATFTITPSAELGGTISPATVQTVDAGTDITFTITPDPGRHIADVLVDGASVGAVGSYEFTGVAADHTIVASFALVLPTITITNPAGPVSWATGSSQPVGWSLDTEVSTGRFAMWLIDSSGNYVTGAYVPVQAGLTYAPTLSLAGVAPAAGYKLRVSYQAVVGGPWVASGYSAANITVTGAAFPTITVTTPTVSWPSGSSPTVEWNLSSEVSTGRFAMWLIDSSGNYVTGAYVPVQAGLTYAPTLSLAGVAPDAGYKLRVSYQAVVGGPWVASGYSAANITVTGGAFPTITITNPPGAISWASGSSQPVGWSLDTEVSTGRFAMWLISSTGNYVTGAYVPVQAGLTYAPTLSLAGVAPDAGYKLRVSYQDVVGGPWVASGYSAANITVTP